jgi:type IV secretory pathway TrbD component
MRPTYRSLNKHLMLMGCDRQLMIAAMFVGFGLFVTLSSITVGLVTFGCFAALGRFKAKDPATLRLIFNPGGARNQYDPAIRRPFPVMFFHDDETV